MLTNDEQSFFSIWVARKNATALLVATRQHVSHLREPFLPDLAISLRKNNNSITLTSLILINCFHRSTRDLTRKKGDKKKSFSSLDICNAIDFIDL